MASCRSIRPILSRVIDGEVSPEDSLRVARHLPACTACRIVLARERRLARMLEALDHWPVNVALFAKGNTVSPEALWEQVRGGAAAVGQATTSAVVSSIFLIILSDSVFAVILRYWK